MLQYRMIILIAIGLIVVFFTGCAVIDPYEERFRSRAAAFVDGATSRSITWLCNDNTIGGYQRATAGRPDFKEGYDALCGSVEGVWEPPDFEGVDDESTVDDDAGAGIARDDFHTASARDRAVGGDPGFRWRDHDWLDHAGLHGRGARRYL